MIKLIATDLDGTLLNEQKQISERNIRALKKAMAQDIKIVICSGRSWSGVKPVFEDLKKRAGIIDDKDEYMIINNGCATISSKNYEVVKSHQLSVEDIKDLKTYVDNQDTVQYTLFDLDNYFCLHEVPNKHVEYDAALVFVPVRQLKFDKAISGNYKMLQAMYLADKDDLDDFVEKNARELSEKYSVVRSQDYIFEIMPKGVTKSSALRELCDHLNISSDEVMAIGDANNDLEMLKFAKYGVAMGNATDLVKTSVQYHTLSNEEDGVAYIIEQFLSV